MIFLDFDRFFPRHDLLWHLASSHKWNDIEAGIIETQLICRDINLVDPVAFNKEIESGLRESCKDLATHTVDLRNIFVANDLACFNEDFTGEVPDHIFPGKEKKISYVSG